jgi:heme-degrading monooxygenase HmoA
MSGGRRWLPAMPEAKITTLVVWTSDAIYEQWRASPERAIAMKGAEALWSRPPESERFLVA